jgi:F-type H+-transporting ATPase subunit epsilon
MSYKQGPAKRYLAVSGGYAEVLDNTMTVLATSAEYADEIDVERARRAEEQAEKQMRQLNPDDQEFITAAAVLRWAKVQIQVANRESGD